MGFNAGLAGFASAEAMVATMHDGEDAQLLSMARVLRASRTPRRNGRTGPPSRAATTVRCTRNGPVYARNQYDVKLEQSYARLVSGSLPDLRLRAAQIALLYLSFSPGRIDGVLGRRTRRALNGFRLQTGLAPGDLDGPCRAALREKAGQRP
jgi:peptidoglycan hydrolase-like protein with peptidoglycan-binding domain